MKWEKFTLFCGKFIQDTIYEILSESSKFYRRYDKNILAYFFLGHACVVVVVVVVVVVIRAKSANVVTLLS